jgi:hypothetical protein
MYTTIDDYSATNTAQLPCWCLFFLGLFMYLNFSQVGGDHMYLYYPVILIGLAVAVLFNPLKIGKYTPTADVTFADNTFSGA